jgi:hypothetical protein
MLLGNVFLKKTQPRFSSWETLSPSTCDRCSPLRSCFSQLTQLSVAWSPKRVRVQSTNFWLALTLLMYCKQLTRKTTGVMLSELADALEAPKQRLALYVAHDTSIVRLAAGLGIFPLRWPRLGSEIVIEVRLRGLVVDDRPLTVTSFRSGKTRSKSNLPGSCMMENS